MFDLSLSLFHLVWISIFRCRSVNRLDSRSCLRRCCGCYSIRRITHLKPTKFWVQKHWTLKFQRCIVDLYYFIQRYNTSRKLWDRWVRRAVDFLFFAYLNNHAGNNFSPSLPFFLLLFFFFFNEVELHVLAKKMGTLGYLLPTTYSPSGVQGGSQNWWLRTMLVRVLL